MIGALRSHFIWMDNVKLIIYTLLRVILLWIYLRNSVHGDKMLLDDYGEIEGDAACVKNKERKDSRNVKATKRVLYKEFLPRVYQFL